MFSSQPDTTVSKLNDDRFDQEIDQVIIGSDSLPTMNKGDMDSLFLLEANLTGISFPHWSESSSDKNMLPSFLPTQSRYSDHNLLASLQPTPILEGSVTAGRAFEGSLQQGAPNSGEPVPPISFANMGPLSSLQGRRAVSAESSDSRMSSNQVLEVEDDEDLLLDEKPKRSLSAYNFFFQQERKNLLKTLPVKGKKPRKSHGKIGFADMARCIASKWKQISPSEKNEFKTLAALDRQRYDKEMAVWKLKQSNNALQSMKKHQVSFEAINIPSGSLPSRQQETGNFQWSPSVLQEAGELWENPFIEHV